MPKTPEQQVDDMLAEVPSHRPGIIERNEPLVRALRRFLELKAANDSRVQHITLAWFYVNKLREEFKGPKTIDCVRAFVRDVLKLDPKTGKAL